MPLPITKTLSAAGSTPPIPIRSPINSTINQVVSSSGSIGIIIHLSAGAILTYSIEVTGDDVNAAGYNPASGLWTEIADLAALSASATAFMLGLVMGIRLTISAYTSGSATLQIIQND